MKKSILKIMIGSVILEVLVICFFIIIGINGNTYFGKISASILCVFLYCIPCLFYTRLCNNEKYKYVVKVGVYMVIVAGVMSILSNWGLFDVKQKAVKLAIVSSASPIHEVIPVVSNIINSLNSAIVTLAFMAIPLSYPDINKIFNIFKKSTIVLLGLSFINTIIYIWIPEIIQYNEILQRLVLVVTILTIGSLICLLITRIMYKKEINELRNKEEKNDTTDTVKIQEPVVQLEPQVIVQDSSVVSVNQEVIQPQENTIPTTNQEVVLPKQIEEQNNDDITIV